jgi:hypothetical protein
MQGKQRGKTSSILIVAEGNHDGPLLQLQIGVSSPAEANIAL